MKLEMLLTKWVLMGLLEETNMLYNTFNDDNQATMMVKMATVMKDGKVAYITYRETYDPKYLKNRFKLLNADIASDLFNIGPLTLESTLTELDEHFWKVKYAILIGIFVYILVRFPPAGFVILVGGILVYKIHKVLEKINENNRKF